MHDLCCLILSGIDVYVHCSICYAERWLWPNKDENDNDDAISGSQILESSQFSPILNPGIGGISIPGLQKNSLKILFRLLDNKITILAI